MLKIGLLGYGVMGRLLDELSESMDCKVVAKIDPVLGVELKRENLHEAEVVIDFSLGSCVVENARQVCKWGKKIVVGATGFDLQELKKIKGDIIYASNFSVGVNLFMRVVESAAKLFDKVKDYDVCGVEYHHRRKIDSPSGTAQNIAEVLLKNISSKKKLMLDRVEGRIKPDELHFASVRCGDIPGTHLIDFDSTADTIELRHTARNRKGFALGALRAAKFLADNKGFYRFEDVFDEILGLQN